MSPHDKAALLLKTLGPEVAESVLANLPPEQGKLLRARMLEQAKSPPPAPDVDAVFDEFEQLLRQPPPAPEKPKPEPAPAVQEPPPPPERPPAPPPPENFDDAPDPMAAIKLLDPDRLASALKGENPRTVALVLGTLDTGRAGELLKRLSPEIRRDTVGLLGQPIKVGGEIVQRIARALLMKCQAAREAGPEAMSPVKRMADILRCLDKPERMELLAALDERDPQLAAAVKEQLYQFEDLMLIEDRSMQKLLSEVDSRGLATALSGAAAEIKEKVLNNLSKRARESLNEEMEFLGAVAAAQVQQAQKAIVEVIQRLDQAGELVMKS